MYRCIHIYFFAVKWAFASKSYAHSHRYASVMCSYCAFVMLAYTPVNLAMRHARISTRYAHICAIRTRHLHIFRAHYTRTYAYLHRTRCERRGGERDHACSDSLIYDNVLRNNTKIILCCITAFWIKLLPFMLTQPYVNSHVQLV